MCGSPIECFWWVEDQVRVTEEQGQQWRPSGTVDEVEKLLTLLVILLKAWTLAGNGKLCMHGIGRELGSGQKRQVVVNRSGGKLRVVLEGRKRRMQDQIAPGTSEAP